MDYSTEENEEEVRGAFHRAPNGWRSGGPFNLRHHKTPMVTDYDGDELEGEGARFLKTEEIRLYQSYMC